jgi:hypothetical protein
MKSSLSLRAGALIVRATARTGRRLNPFPRNWTAYFEVMEQQHANVNSTGAFRAGRVFKAAPRARQRLLPAGESGRLRMSGFATWLVGVFLHLMSMPQLQKAQGAKAVALVLFHRATQLPIDPRAVAARRPRAEKPNRLRDRSCATGGHRRGHEGRARRRRRRGGENLRLEWAVWLARRVGRELHQARCSRG